MTAATRRRGGSAAYVVLEQGRSPTPYQARCRGCRWKSRWSATVDQVRAEHGRHQAVAHIEVRVR